MYNSGAEKSQPEEWKIFYLMGIENLSLIIMAGLYHDALSRLTYTLRPSIIVGEGELPFMVVALNWTKFRRSRL